MDYKKKMKTRLLLSITFGALGFALMLIYWITGTENQFLFSFGVALMVIGVMRTIQYRKNTKDDKTIRQKELEETDERFRMMIERAKAWAFSFYLMICGVIVIVLSLLGYREQALPYAWSICGLITIYWLCWLVIRKKY